jgi:hypothetical protein
MPHVVSTAFEEYLISANMAFGMYNGLTMGATAAIMAKGSTSSSRPSFPR